MRAGGWRGGFLQVQVEVAKQPEPTHNQWAVVLKAVRDVGLSDCLDPDLIHFLSSLRPFHTFLLNDIFFFSLCVFHGTFSIHTGRLHTAAVDNPMV